MYNYSYPYVGHSSTFYKIVRPVIARFLDWTEKRPHRMSWQLRSVLLVAWASATCALPAGTKLKAPRNWRTTFDLISELRADRTAVVDQMGTEAITKAATAEDAPFHALVSLMLSSQTKDTVNLATMQALREATKQTGLTPASILAMSDEELDGYIYAVGFHNRKVEYLKRTSQLILEKHNGIVPDNMDDLLAFPGVG